MQQPLQHSPLELHRSKSPRHGGGGGAVVVVVVGPCVVVVVVGAAVVVDVVGAAVVVVGVTHCPLSTIEPAGQQWLGRLLVQVSLRSQTCSAQHFWVLVLEQLSPHGLLPVGQQISGLGRRLHWAAAQHAPLQHF
jgi:hypothetical protein